MYLLQVLFKLRNSIGSESDIRAKGVLSEGYEHNASASTTLLLLVKSVFIEEKILLLK